MYGAVTFIYTGMLGIEAVWRFLPHSFYGINASWMADLANVRTAWFAIHHHAACDLTPVCLLCRNLRDSVQGQKQRNPRNSGFEEGEVGRRRRGVF